MIKLTKKQKMFLFKNIMDAADVVKIFDLCELAAIDYWLVKEPVSLKKNSDGWYGVYVDNQLYTSLNPNVEPEQFNILLNGLNK